MVLKLRLEYGAALHAVSVMAQNHDLASSVYARLPCEDPVGQNRERGLGTSTRPGSPQSTPTKSKAFGLTNINRGALNDF